MKIDSLFVDNFLRLTGTVPDEIVLDLDAKEAPLHGHQLGSPKFSARKCGTLPSKIRD